jgi:heat shock protein HtpX
MAHDPTRNRERTVALLAGAVTVPAVLGLLLGLVVGGLVALLLLGLLVGLAVALSAWFGSSRFVLRGLGARPVALPADVPTGSPAARGAGVQRLENLVEGLCMASGLPQPALYLVEDPSPNARAVGVQRQRAAVVVTTGLLDVLTRVELEGVVGHLLARIRRDDIVPATLAAFLLGPLAQRALPPGVALEADAAAVATTRYPPGLAAALTKLKEDPRPVARCPRASLPLWIVPAAPAGTRPTDPDLDHRIAVLREL